MPAALRFLGLVATQVRRAVSAQAVAPALTHANGDWWGRWTLAPQPAVLSWLHQLADAVPASLLRESEWPAGAELISDFTMEITDLMVRDQTAAVDVGLPTRTTFSPLINWVISLATGQPVHGWDSGAMRPLAEKIAAWRNSGLRVHYGLTLRLEDQDFAEDSPGVWRLGVRLHHDSAPLVGLTTREVAARPDRPEDPEWFLANEYQRAALAYPPLTTYQEHGLDRVLTTQQAVELVADGAQRLRAVGVSVEVPGTWVEGRLSLTLKAQRVDADQHGPRAGMGLEQLVGYTWRAALGNEDLSEDELRAIVDSKAPLVRMRGQWVYVDRKIAHRTLEFLTHGGDIPQRASLSSLLGQLIGPDAPPVPVDKVEGADWLADFLSGRSSQTLSPTPEPKELRTELRPYQKRGLSWLSFMSSLGLGVILADDMGLGKTVQLLALLLAERENTGYVGPTLVVCPMSVVGNWHREAARFAPTLRTYVHHGSARAAGTDLAARAAQADLVITTYGIASRDATALSHIDWDRVTLDEAQNIKNSSTKAARALRTFRARHRIALTGTPVENRLEELRSIMDFLNPGIMGSAQSFRKNIADPIETNRDPAAIARLSTVTRPFILRREKSDPAVISDLPPKMEMTVHANLTKEQAGLYQAVVEDMMGRIDSANGVQRRGMILATLTKLKQICNHPAHFLRDGSPMTAGGQNRSGKLSLVQDIITTAVADGEKTLCFTQYRQFGDLVAPWLTELLGHQVDFLHGGLSSSARERLINRFQTGSSPVLVVSLKAGGTGLNLTAASQVIHLDRWWNPAVEDQATDRAYRIGQTRRVQVRKLVCVGTLEERIADIMESKKDLASLAVSTGEGWLTELTSEELTRVIALGAEAVAE